VDGDALSGAGGRPARRPQPETEYYEEEAMMEEEVPEEAAEEEAFNQIVLNPASFEVPKNREFRLSVTVSCEQEIASMTITLSFDPGLLTLKEITEGGFLHQLGPNVPFLKNIDNSGGGCTIGFSSPRVESGLKGEGSIAVLVFEATAAGEGFISVADVTANGPTGQAVSFEISEAQVIVH
jgi:hypothetical protein